MALAEFYYLPPPADTYVNISDILMVATDIAEQVNAHKQIEKNEAYVKMSADRVPSNISNALPNGKVPFFNKKWLEFADLNFEDMQDFRCHQMMHPDEIFRMNLIISFWRISLVIIL
ncbi:hypothetical protein [Chryseobacterium luquanense]|uniref:Uncharacterized protein n=1 Tax=Chryseobacterium luquanense TaxID=2983766 RepID=A0ABT3XY46_9FLAO|nr:hypothetical protein [Chryseobacterium luquanense]MCX8530818.1 hypothetical protein [Chryseobacterium luquanense]